MTCCVYVLYYIICITVSHQTNDTGDTPRYNFLQNNNPPIQNSMSNQPLPQLDPEKPYTLKDIIADVQMMIDNVKTLEPPDMGNYLFRVHTAGTWMRQASKRPIPKMLFGELWYEGELCIL